MSGDIPRVSGADCWPDFFQAAVITPLVPQPEPTHCPPGELFSELTAFMSCSCSLLVCPFRLWHPGQIPPGPGGRTPQVSPQGPGRLEHPLPCPVAPAALGVHGHLSCENFTRVRGRTENAPCRSWVEIALLGQVARHRPWFSSPALAWTGLRRPPLGVAYQVLGFGCPQK